MRRLIRKQLEAALITATAFSVFASSAFAQQTKAPITIVVPFSAGHGPDILARTLGEELQQRLGQPVIVDNKPGASGNIGAAQVARAAPDGHTILMTTNPFANNVALFSNLPFNPVKSFEPIVYVAQGTLALTLHPSVPAKTTQEFIRYVKERPGQVNYGSPGIGTPHHLAMELFELATQTDLTHIPYRGAAGATQDLIGGHVSAGFQPIHVISPAAANKQVSLLATASLERVPSAPNLPTLSEQGLKGFNVDLWYGIFAPAGTPKEIVSKYNAAFNDILAKPEIKERLAKQGLVTVGGSADRLREFLPKEITKWQTVVKEAGIKKIEEQ